RARTPPPGARGARSRCGAGAERARRAATRSRGRRPRDRARAAPTTVVPRTWGLPVRCQQALGADQRLERLVAEAFFDARGLGLRFRREVLAARAGFAALPVGEISIGGALAGAHGGAVDGLLEARRQLHLGGLAAALDDHLRGDVAPGDDGQACHAGAPWFAIRVRRRVPSCP